MTLSDILFQTIAPIFIVIGISAFVGWRFKPDPRGLSVFLIYVFVPALVFRGLSDTSLSGGEAGGIAAVAVLVALVMVGMGLAIARFYKYPPRTAGAFVLCLMMVNAANYGIPLNTFAFGPEGGERAIIYYVASVMVSNVLGVYFASRGAVSTRDAIRNVLTVPIIYAAIVGFIVNISEITLPLALDRSIDLAADAAIPGMLALLGLQLARTEVRGRIRPILLATGSRLLVGPVVAVVIATVLGLQGVSFKVAVVESSMPTAVLASALATQFDSDAELTSAVTLVSTLASVVTLSGLILLLG